MTEYTLKHLTTGTLAGAVIDGAASLDQLTEEQINNLIKALDDFEEKIRQHLLNQVADSLS